MHGEPEMKEAKLLLYSKYSVLSKGKTCPKPNVPNPQHLLGTPWEGGLIRRIGRSIPPLPGGMDMSHRHTQRCHFPCLNCRTRMDGRLGLSTCSKRVRRGCKYSGQGLQ